MSPQRFENVQPPTLLLNEYFDGEDFRFVGLLMQFDAPKYLANFVEKWKRESRPWARDQIFTYLRGNLNLPGHEVVFKRTVQARQGTLRSRTHGRIHAGSRPHGAS